MILVKITKRFHEATMIMKRGEYFEEYMRFVDVDYADAWAESINQSKILPYHIPSISLDNGVEIVYGDVLETKEI